ncbi:MAG TPA: CTP synthase [Planctomycetota bacterium]|nr:CTP synthase [Planctomycetota bacterium]
MVNTDKAEKPAEHARRSGPTRHIFITGGVVSSLGKGITCASIGRLLKNMGYSVRIQKLDPYLNVDPGTMNPFQHGEVFVTADGAETDLDLGHYERFLAQPCTRHSTYTSGRIYQSVIQKEREGRYNGGTVQVVPHITNEIKDAIKTLIGPEVDVLITEIGGTVGDIEGLPFMEAVRQFAHEIGREYVAFMHLAYIPYIRAAGEIKTKPAQHSVQKLREIGIVPDFLVCRSEKNLSKEVKEKLALFCNVAQKHVVEMPDVATSIYEVPQVLLKQDVHNLVSARLGLKSHECDMRAWDLMVRHIKNPKDTVTIALVGKYINHQDAYKSVTESIDHAAYAHLVKANIVRIESETLEKDDWQDRLKGIDGVLVPGGFGKRGFEGKLNAIRYCREHNLPYLGLCLGMQAASIEFARNVLKLDRANSTEMDEKTPDPIIVLMESQKDVVAVGNLGGTMRLGSFICTLPKKSSKTTKLYGGAETVSERHRHRYEFNNAYRAQFEAAGMQFTGLYIPDPLQPEKSLVEIIELKDHPFFVATQAHPEFQSSPVEPHPLFKGLLGAAYKHKTKGVDPESASAGG